MEVTGHSRGGRGTAHHPPPGAQEQPHTDTSLGSPGTLSGTRYSLKRGRKVDTSLFSEIWLKVGAFCEKTSLHHLC